MITIQELMSQCGITRWTTSRYSKKGNLCVTGENIVGYDSDFGGSHAYATHLTAVFNPKTGQVYMHRIMNDDWGY